MRQKKKYNILSGCGAVGSARGLGPRGPEFETLHSDQTKKTAFAVFFYYIIENKVYPYVVEMAKQGKTILFVGTKKQAQETIKEEALRAGEFFVNERWLGGMLTNYQTIEKRIKRLNKLAEMEADGTLELLTKKEKFKLLNEKEKLERFLGGIKDMPELPGALFVIDPRKEKIAVTEAKKLGIPVVAIVDTNCDPDDVDYVIPGNDDAIRAVKLLASVISDAVLEAKQGESMAEATEEVVVEEAVEVQE